MRAARRASADRAGRARTTNAQPSLAERFVRHADDGGARHLGVRREQVLDLARVDVEAAADEHLAAPAAQVEVAGVVEESEVARADPACRASRRPPWRRGRSSSRAWLPASAPRRRRPRRRASAPPSWPAMRSSTPGVGLPTVVASSVDGVVGQRRGGDADLGGRVAHAHPRRSSSLHAPDQLGRRRRAAEQHVRERAQIAPRAVGVVEEHDGLGREWRRCGSGARARSRSSTAAVSKVSWISDTPRVADLDGDARHRADVRERQSGGEMQRRARRPVWRRASISASASRLRCAYHAPFGAPVVPLVKTIATAASGETSTVRRADRAPPARRSTHATVPPLISSASSQTRAAAGSSASTMRAEVGVVPARDAEQQARRPRARGRGRPRCGGSAR